MPFHAVRSLSAEIVLLLYIVLAMWKKIQLGMTIRGRVCYWAVPQSACGLERVKRLYASPIYPKHFWRSQYLGERQLCRKSTVSSGS